MSDTDKYILGKIALELIENEKGRSGNKIPSAPTYLFVAHQRATISISPGNRMIPWRECKSA